MSIAVEEASRYRQFEDQFLSQLRGKALALARGKLPADTIVISPTPEGMDSLRQELLQRQVYDRDALEQLPGGGCVEMRFIKQKLGGLFDHTVARVRVRVLTDLDALLDGGAAKPVGREQVLDALAHYDVLPRKDRPTAVVFASPSGFTSEARALVGRENPYSLVLMGGRVDGGWDAELPLAVKKSAWAKLFELETQDERLKRLLYHLRDNATLVESRGMPVAELAQKAGLTTVETEARLRQAARQNPQLMLVRHESGWIVCRTPLAEEGTNMSLWSRVRRLLGLKPTAAERVRQMTETRVKLEQQRGDVDSKLQAFEAQERGAIEDGVKAGSDAEKRQIAQRLMRVRRDLKLTRAQANTLTQQIDILNTQIHNLTLAEQGRRVEMPKAEDLTAAAAEAEGVLAELSANADLARGIEVGGASPMMAEEEAAILEEFKQISESRVGTKPEAAPTTASKTPAGPVRENPSRLPPVPERKSERDSARPEIS